MHHGNIAGECGGEVEAALAAEGRNRIGSIGGHMDEKVRCGVEEDVVEKKEPVEAFVFGLAAPLARKAFGAVLFRCRPLLDASAATFPVLVSLQPRAPGFDVFPLARAHLAVFELAGLVNVIRGQ